jgi:hypothetical protein
MIPEPKPVGDLSHRTLKKTGGIDPQSNDPNNKTEITDLHSWKKQKPENGKHIRIATLVI